MNLAINYKLLALLVSLLLTIAAGVTYFVEKDKAAERQQEQFVQDVERYQQSEGRISTSGMQRRMK